MHKKQRAITFVELLIATVVTLIILAATHCAIMVGMKIYKDLQEDLKKNHYMVIATEHLEKHIKDSAYIQVVNAKEMMLFDRLGNPLGRYFCDPKSKALSFNEKEIAHNIDLDIKETSEAKAGRVIIEFKEPFTNKLYVFCRHSS